MQEEDCGERVTVVKFGVDNRGSDGTVYVSESKQVSIYGYNEDQYHRFLCCPLQI